MQDMDENDSSQQYIRSSKQDSSHRERGGGQSGFVVAGAPWENQSHGRHAAAAPNTASNEEFPSFGGASNAPASASASAPAPTWGPRR